MNGEKGIPGEGSKQKRMPRRQEKKFENRKKAYREREVRKKVCPGGKKRSLKTRKRHTGRRRQATKYARAPEKEAKKQKKGIPEEENKQPSMPRQQKKKQKNRKKACRKRNKQEKILCKLE